MNQKSKKQSRNRCGCDTLNVNVLLVGQDAFLEDELLNIAGRWSAAKRLKTSEKMARWVSQLRDSVNFAESRTN
jgi:hypothetical protein